jgi:bifunctional UDP-N-acetylglucosamine pyrophosphorylase/glucosamine-1-phosphate N-acetyltransferase
MSDPLTVVILAAGQGTRMKSDLPKVLHTIGGRPLLAHVARDAQLLGAEKICIVYGHGGEQVQQAMGGHAVEWVHQAQQLGTGHAVEQAMPAIPDTHTVLLLYGDVPLITMDTLRRLVAASSGGALALLTTILEEPTGYGRILRDGAGKIQGIVEQKDATPEQLAIREINTGMMAVSAARLRGWLTRLENSNAQGEFYLTDIVAMAVADGVGVNTMGPEDNVEIEGINNKQQLAELERAYQRREARRMMLEGLTLRDPERFDVRGEVRFGRDVVVDINVILEGQVTLGDRVTVGPNTLLKDVTIGDDVTIRPNCVIESSRVGNGCEIGPFARIRPETELAEQVKIGNFVEIKKSIVAGHSKINHLSYVGDTTMGSHVNVGAGTITCNYDGANKHRTVIGDNVFIGSDTQLVAPVTVEEGATIGAGSTITRDAPAHSLTLSRSAQVTKADWKRPQKKQ